MRARALLVVPLCAVLQPPDAGHAAAVAVLHEEARDEDRHRGDHQRASLSEFLALLAEKHGFGFQLKGDQFKAEGVPNVAAKKPMIKAAKGATLDAILRDALKSVDADYAIDGYGNLSWCRNRRCRRNEAGV